MMTDQARVERWQRVMRVALERMEALRFGDLDEVFYDALRDALLAAGATEGEIGALVHFLITFVVEQTAPNSETRAMQFELIAEHLARSTVRVELSPADTVLTIEFPDRPRPH